MDSYTLMISTAFSCFVLLVAVLSLYKRYKLKEMRNKIELVLKSLDKYDFNIISETKTGAVNISQDILKKYGIGYLSKRLDLSGETKVEIQIPVHSVEVCYIDYYFKNNMGMPESVWITEQQYKEYLNLVKDCSSVSTTSYFLKIELQNSDVISLITKWNKWMGNDIYTKYEFERYNVLNLVTNMQPFSEDEIDSIIDKIKDRMVERLNY